MSLILLKYINLNDTMGMSNEWNSVYLCCATSGTCISGFTKQKNHGCFSWAVQELSFYD